MKSFTAAAALAALVASAPLAHAEDPTVVWYPSVVNTEGLNGARYYSVLSVWNPSATEITLTVDGFVSNGSGLSAPTATVTATVPAATHATTPNVLSSGSLLQLSNASAEDRAMGIGKRTNVGTFNPSFDTKSVTIRAWTSNATLIGEETRSIPAWSQVQQPVFDLVPPTTAGDTVHEDFLVTFEVQGGGLLVYSTVVDNRTNDGVYQAAE